MDGARLELVGRRDGRRWPLDEGTQEALTALLVAPHVQRHLVGQGLEVVRTARGYRMGAGSLHSALVRLAATLDSAPRAVREDAALGDDPRQTVARLVRAVSPAATGSSSVAQGGVEVIVELPATADRPVLEAVPEPPAADQALLAMERVGPGEAEALLRHLDELVSDVQLPTDLLLRALEPLLADESSSGMAARVLGRAAVFDSTPALERALSRTQSLGNRLEILGALMRLGRRELALRTLRSMLVHGHDEARERAVDVLEAVAGPEDLAALREMLRLARPVERVRLAALTYRFGERAAFREVVSAVDGLGPHTAPGEAERTLRAIESLNSRLFVPALEAFGQRETRAWFVHRTRALIQRLEQADDGDSTIEELLAAAEEAYYDGRRGEAHELLDELLELIPDHPRALYLKANCLKEASELEPALAAAERALSSDPASWRLHRLRGSLLWDVGRHLEALEAYDRALSHNPVDPYTWYYRGYVLYRLERYDEALPCLDRALTLTPDAPAIYNQKAFCLERLGLHDEAARCYRKSLQLRPHDPVIRDYLGQALQTAGELEGALSCFDEVLYQTPERDETLYHRADVLFDMGRYEDSEAAFEAFLERRPDAYEAWFNRGLCLRYLGRHDDAGACFRQALRLRPESPTAKAQLELCDARRAH